MKKIPAAFLLSIIIFAFFMVISLLKTPPSPNSVTTATPLARQNAVTATCIVTINSQKYDVSQYRYQHQGGNIFQCNTDMSAVFAGQHSQSYLNKMKRYLIP